MNNRLDEIKRCWYHRPETPDVVDWLIDQLEQAQAELDKEQICRRTERDSSLNTIKKQDQDRVFLKQTNKQLEARCKILGTGLSAVKALMDDSRGVIGLHLNGDDAPWDELRTGGKFEEWLMDFDAAMDLIEPTPQGKGD